MKKRDRAFKRAWKMGKPEDMTYAKTLRQELTKYLRVAKRKFILTQLDLAKGVPKKFWNIIYSTFFKCQTAEVAKVIDESCNELIEGFEASEYVNDNFCTISDRMGREFKPLNQTIIEDLFNLPDINDEWPCVLNVDTVVIQIKKIDISKASGFVEINSKLLKESLLSLKEPFTYILNMCMEQCRFPDSWKSATVVVIPKKGNSKQVSNLRPISLLPVPGKILEHFLNQFLINFMENNGYLPVNKWVFVKTIQLLKAVSP